MVHITKRSFLRTVFDNTVYFLSGLGGAWIVVLMLIIVADVLGRNFFGQSVVGTPEIVKNTIVCITFFQMAHVLREGRHIRTTFALERVGFLGKTVMSTLANVLGIILFILILASIWEPAIKAYRIGDYEGAGALPIPMWPVYLVLIIGSVMTIIQFVLNIYDDITYFSKLRLKKEEVIVERSVSNPTEG